jgi:hypothetical protein
VQLHAQAEPKRLYAATHMDNQPMSLLCTTGISAQAAVHKYSIVCTVSFDKVGQKIFLALRRLLSEWTFFLTWRYAFFASWTKEMRQRYNVFLVMDCSG